MLRLLGVTDLPVHLRGYVEALGAGIPTRPDDLLLRPPERRGRENRQQYARPLLSGIHAGHLRPCDHRRPTQSRPGDGEYPLPCCLMLSAARSRWGQRLGQKKAAGENNNLCKQKDPKPYGFRSFWHAVRDSNPRTSGP